MKFALVFPRFNKLHKEQDPPLGIAYISAYLREKNKDVRIFDGTFLSEEEVLRGLEEYKPDLVGITVHTSTVENDFLFAEKTKNRLPNAKVVFGGPHPTIMPEHVLANKNVDIVAIGEGENTALDLLEMFDNLDNVKGIYYKKNGSVIKTGAREFIQNLDVLPFPARDLLSPKYFENGNATIMCSRGCIFNCAFCQPTLRKIFGNVRFRSPKNVVDEMEHIMKNYATKIMLLHDDTFTVNKKWAMDICDEIIGRGLKFKWICKGRINTIDAELLQKLKDAGCTDIEFGVESGAPTIRNKILNKNITNDQIVEVFRLCWEAGIKPTAFIMLGSPFETRETLKETVDLLKKIKPAHTVVSITTPMPGTLLYDQCKEGNLITATSFSELDFARNVTIKHESITEKDIRDTQKQINMLTYTNYAIYCIMNGKFDELFGAVARRVKRPLKWL